MENAAKALIIAGGILIGILIIVLLITLFINGRELNASYDKRKQEEAIQQFNVHFTKYIGQTLNIQQLKTIDNYANLYNVIVRVDGKKLDTNIKEDIEKSYKIYNMNYDSNGYVKEIFIVEVSA